MRKRDYPKVLRRGVAVMVILLLLLLLLGAFAPVAMAGDWPFCDHWQCRANDVVVTDLYLGDVSGSPLPPCNVLDTVEAYIWIEFTSNANSKRTAVILLANITIDGVLEESFWDGGSAAGLCVLDNITGGATSKADIYDFSWTCGSEVKLEDIIVSWEPPSGGDCPEADRSCGVRNTKCNSSADIIVRPPPIANFTLTKAADPASATVGDIITYTVTVTNNGDINLTNIQVIDDPTGTFWTVPILNITESNVTTFQYTVTERYDDICDGWINNTVTATAWNPLSGTVVGPKYASANVSTSYDANLAITKVANNTGPVIVGDVIEYNITVENTGDVNLTEVNVTDDLTKFYHQIAKLEPGKSESFKPTYTVTEADICNDITNTATVNATDPCLKLVGPETATETVTTDYTATLAITKVAAQSIFLVI